MLLLVIFCSGERWPTLESLNESEEQFHVRPSAFVSIPLSVAKLNSRLSLLGWLSPRNGSLDDHFLNYNPPSCNSWVNSFLVVMPPLQCSHLTWGRQHRNHARWSLKPMGIVPNNSPLVSLEIGWPRKRMHKRYHKSLSLTRTLLVAGSYHFAIKCVVTPFDFDQSISSLCQQWLQSWRCGI